MANRTLVTTFITKLLIMTDIMKYQVFVLLMKMIEPILL
nr:MAG TPA: hypothetical protein [Bacteriophage sp.]